MPISFACVPYVMDLSTVGNCPETNGNKIPRAIGENKVLVDFINKGMKEGKYDVLLHGYTHEYKIDSAGKRYPEMIWRDSEELKKIIPEGKKYLEELFVGILESMNENTTEVLWKYRPIIKEKVEKEDDRRKIFEQLLSLCLSGLEPDEKTVENLIEEYEQ